MKNSVNRALKFIAAYILIMILGLFICGSSFMVYSMCKSLVAGRSLKFIDVNLFIHGLLFFAPFVFFATGAFSIFYLIRHEKDSFIARILFFVFYISTWIFLLPLSVKADAYFISSKTFNTQRMVSTGYFRNLGDKIVYYSHLNLDNTADGVIIKNQHMEYFHDENVTIDSDDFSDSIIQQDMQMDYFARVLIGFYRNFINFVRALIERGFVSWLCFASIALVLVGLSALRRVSCWRLLNFTLISVFYSAAIYVHWLLCTSDIFLKPRAFFARTLSFIHGDSFVLCVNVLVAALLFVAEFVIAKLRDEN